MKPMMQNTMKMSARTAPTQTATAAMVVREMFGFVVGEGGRVGDWRSPGWGGGGACEGEFNSSSLYSVPYNVYIIHVRSTCMYM